MRTPCVEMVGKIIPHETKLEQVFLGELESVQVETMRSWPEIDQLGRDPMELNVTEDSGFASAHQSEAILWKLGVGICSRKSQLPTSATPS